VKRFEVVIEPQALDDIERYYRRVVEAGAKDTADKWFHRIVSSILELEILPGAGARIPEQDAFEVELLQRVFAGRYRIIYTIAGSRVHVLCVRGAGMRALRPSDLGAAPL